MPNTDNESVIPSDSFYVVEPGSPDVHYLASDCVTTLCHITASEELTDSKIRQVTCALCQNEIRHIIKATLG